MNNLNNMGFILAASGSAISIIGTLYNNLKLDHNTAMRVWAVSNPVLMIWSVGLAYNWWDGGLPGIALASMYFVFTVTNLWGLFSKRTKP